MQFFEVTDKAIAKEIISETKRLEETKSFIADIAYKYGFCGVHLSTDTALPANEFFFKGILQMPDGRLSAGQAKNFKHKGRADNKYVIPKKHFVDQLKGEMQGIDLGEYCHMNDTWGKLVKYRVYATLSSILCDRVCQSFSTNDGRVFVAIHAKHEDANLNIDALVEIKKSEYLAFAGQ